MPSIEDQRRAVVEEARRWIGTPFKHAGRIKGVGADCNGFLAGVYHATGMCEFIEFQHYPRDWFLHSHDDRYLNPIMDRCVEVITHDAGDIVLFRQGKLNEEGFAPWSHGGIIVEWPLIIHARWKSFVEYDDATKYPLNTMPDRRFASPKAWHP